MDREYDRSVPSGGAAGGGGSFHVSFRSGSRAGGASGAATFDYITRNDQYDTEGRDPAIYTESGHMPDWAEDDPSLYWDAADLHERANGRIFVSADFALPRELSVEDQIDLARAFAHELTDEERLPYTLAIHEGRNADGEIHNPHAHLMFSERQHDGLDRSPEDWFKRANPDHPEQGGAPKSRTFHGAPWVENARARWAELTNEALARAGSDVRVDHRSYERQGIDQEPGEHYGPAAPHMLERGAEHERFDAAVEVGDHAQALQEIDAEISRVEQAIEQITTYGLPDERDSRERDYSYGSGPSRDDDHSWGR